MEQYFKRLVEIGIAMSVEKDPDRLLEMILREAQEIGAAEAGTLFIRNDDVLRFAIVRNDSLGFAAGGTSGVDVDLPPLRIFNGSKPDLKNVAAYVVHTGETTNVDDAYDSKRFDFAAIHKFDQLASYRTQPVLTVPIKVQSGQVIGVLQLLNHVDADTRESIPFTDEFVTFVETIALQAAVAIENLAEREQLLESINAANSDGRQSIFISHASANREAIESEILPILDTAGAGY